MHKGEVVKNLIKKSGYTQRKLAQELDLNEKYFSALLKDQNFRADLIDKVCEILGVNPDDHFSEDQSDNNYDKLYKEHLQSLMEHNIEKSKWLDEKLQLIDEKKELQDEVIRLRMKYGEIGVDK